MGRSNCRLGENEVDVSQGGVTEARLPRRRPRMSVRRKKANRPCRRGGRGRRRLALQGSGCQSPPRPWREPGIQTSSSAREREVGRLHLAAVVVVVCLEHYETPT